MNPYDEKVQPEFAIGDTVTYMPHDRAYQATVRNYRYIGAAAHPDEIEYVLEVEADAMNSDWITTCRNIYESCMYRRSNDICWGPL